MINIQTIGWLLLDAAVLVATDVSISAALPSELAEDNRKLLLLATLSCGAGLTFAVNKIKKPWTMPAASVTIAAVFIPCAVSCFLARPILYWIRSAMTRVSSPEGLRLF